MVASRREFSGQLGPGIGAIVSAVILHITLGCASDDDRSLPKGRIWESDHFRYHTWPDDTQPCEAVLGQLERHFALMQGYLGFPWPVGRKVEYYKFRDRADYVANSECSENSDSCTSDSAVFSPHVLQDHELIHAYLAALAMPPAFFVEGAAEALACDHVYEMLYPKPWQDVVTEPFGVPFGRARYEGSWFVGYLLYRYGPEPFLALYGRLDYRSATVDRIASAFASVYGDSLDNVWNAGLESSTQTRCVDLWNCAGASLPLDGSIQPLEQACDGSDNSRTFDLSTATDLLISSHRYFLNAPLACDVDLPKYVAGWNEQGVLGEMYDPTLVRVPPGKYFVRSAADGGIPDVGVLALPTPTFSRDCNNLQPFDLSGDRFRKGDVRLSIPNDGNAWYVKLHLPFGVSIYTGSLPTDEVQQCTSCADQPVCAPLDDDGDPDVEGNVTLRLAAPNRDSGYTEYLIRMWAHG